MRTRITLFFVIFFLGFLIFQLSFCGKKKIYSDFAGINEASWNTSDTLNFDFNIQDELIKQTCNISFFGKINQKYQYANLFLYVDLFIDDNLISRDTLHCILYDKFGNLLQRNMGNTVLFRVSYMDTINLYTNKNYKFRIIHGMRNVNLNGIETVGFKIKKN